MQSSPEPICLWCSSSIRSCNQKPHMSPTRHVRPATIQVLAMASLTKVESVLHKETMPVSDFMTLRCSSTTCTRNHPSVPSVRTVVPEEHASMATMFKHLEPYEMPPCPNVPSGMTGAPSVQAIVVDRVSVVEPEVAPIIRDNLEVVMTCPENSHAACPTHSEVIASVEPWPPSTRVTIVHSLARLFVPSL